MAISLFQHNAETYEKLTSMFEVENRVGVVQPTGTGKSFLYLKWIEDNPNDHFVVFSPSVEIFTQLKEYADAEGVPRLLDSVQMITYQSLLRMSNDEVYALEPDKVVLDEFHRTGAEQWGPSLQRVLNAFPAAKILGASATPVRYMDEGKDMSAEIFDRNLAVEMTLGEAVARNILPTPEYVPVWYDIDGRLDSYKKDISQISNTKSRKELDDLLSQLKRRLENSYGAEDIFRKHMPSDHGKFIVFCRDREHLEDMKIKMAEWLSGVNRNIHSYISISAQADKDEHLQSFKDDNSESAIKLLFTIDRLNEGLHVKGIDGVIMLRPTLSPIIYLQQLGRALSVGNEKPLIFDMVNNYQNVRIPGSNGNSINVFEKEFRDAVGSKDVPSEFRIFEDMVSFTSLFDSLEDKLFPSNDQKWQHGFSILEQFVEQHKRLPKRGEMYKDFALGEWCGNQKRLAKTSGYPPDRREKLDKIGLLQSVRERTWNKHFLLLQEFIAEYDRFPAIREQYKGFALGTWCIAQKQSAASPNYPKNRIEKLRSIGLLDHTLEKKWLSTFSLLEEFVAEHKRFPKWAETYKDVALGEWCGSQKTLAKSSKLSPDRLEKLNAIGLLNDTLESKWEQNFNLLNKYISVFGHLPKYNEQYDGVAIGRWCVNQRRLSKSDTFSKDRYQKLSSVGFFDETPSSKAANQSIKTLNDQIQTASQRSIKSTSSADSKTKGLKLDR